GFAWIAVRGGSLFCLVTLIRPDNASHFQIAVITCRQPRSQQYKHQNCFQEPHVIIDTSFQRLFKSISFFAQRFPTFPRPYSAKPSITKRQAQAKNLALESNACREH